MSHLNAVRGTHDLLPEESRRHQQIIDIGRRTVELYGYGEISTPIFELTEVFARTLGDTSDIVTKEMYTFQDRGGDALTLRPENTAGVARAFISGKMTQSLPLKFFYAGPMFRYERPQKGRQRQFHQIGVELLGVAGPLGDVEVISMGARILDRLGILSATTLEINSLGDTESRAAYRTALVDYFTTHKTDLSIESQERLARNPLRILDSKDEGDRLIVAKAPAFADHLNQDSKTFFAIVLENLDRLSISYRLNPQLVRGLDYYNHTAFEFTTDRLGAQGTVLGGGRYDGLISTMGGPATPGVGWAAGVERLAMMIAEPAPAQRPVALVPVGDTAEARAIVIAENLRRAGIAADLGYSGNLKKRMHRANKINARVAVILGETELNRGIAIVRNLDTGEQQDISLENLASSLES
ncbi:MAG: histidine--tRNA ligase [Alphaproteobacteria bacterium]